MKRTYILLLLLAVAGFCDTEAQEVKHRYLGSAYGSKNIFIVDQNGNLEWEVKNTPGVQDVFMLKDGTFVYNTVDGVFRINRDKKVLMKYKNQREIHSVSLMPNGNYLVSLSGQHKLVEINDRGEEVKTITVDSANKDAHMELRDSELTVDGTYLVALISDGKIQELDKNGKKIWEVSREDVPGDFSPSDITRLKNGNTLIATGYGSTVIEINKDKEIVWSLTNQDIDGLHMEYAAAAVRLENGNTLISLYKGSYKFIEVTRDKKVVWGVKDKMHDFYHGSTSITYLD